MATFCIQDKKSLARNFKENYALHSAKQQIPTNKLKHPTADDLSARPAILFYNGTFAPIHSGHLDTVITAKEYLERNGYQVLGGYFSPCWSGYANGKLGINGISARHRLNMCNMVAATTDWMMVDTNEIFAPEFFHPLETVLQFYNRLKEVKSLQHGNFDVFWIKGADCGGFYPLPKTHAHFLKQLVVVNRPGFENRVKSIYDQLEVLTKEYRDCFFTTTSSNMLTISSTEIREACKNGSPIYDNFKLYGLSQVADYITKFSLWQRPWRKFDMFSELPKPLKPLFESEFVCFFDAIKCDVIEAMLGEKLSSFELKDIKSANRSKLIRLSVTSKSPENNESKPSHLGQSLLLKIQKLRIGETLIQGEHVFYKYISPKLASCQVPKCYYSCLSKSDGNDKLSGLILMQDLSETTDHFDFFCQLNTDQIFIIVQSLAEFHADCWCHPCLDDAVFDCLPKMNDLSYISHLKERYGNAFKQFGEAAVRHGDFSEDQYSICSLVFSNIEAVLKKLQEKGSLTLVHGDTFIPNILLPSQEYKKCTCGDKLSNNSVCNTLSSDLVLRSDNEDKHYSSSSPCCIAATVNKSDLETSKVLSKATEQISSNFFEKARGSDLNSIQATNQSKGYAVDCVDNQVETSRENQSESDGPVQDAFAHKCHVTDVYNNGAKSASDRSNERLSDESHQPKISNTTKKSDPTEISENEIRDQIGTNPLNTGRPCNNTNNITSSLLKGNIVWDHPRPYFIDWQTCMIGCPLLDVASFLDSILLPVGSEIEEQVLQVYYNSLVRFGVSKRLYSFEQCFQDFQLCKMWALLIEFVGFVQFYFRSSIDASKEGRVREFLNDRINSMSDYFVLYFPSLNEKHEDRNILSYMKAWFSDSFFTSSLFSFSKKTSPSN